MKIRSPRTMGFRRLPLYRRKQLSLLRYLSRKFAFWTAMFSLLAFGVGNIVGQYGWNVMLTSIFASVDESLITYDGTVSPVKIPDYKRWAQYGGNHWDYTYDQVPKDFLIDLPRYDVAAQRSGELLTAYPVGYMGSYATGEDMDGSHPGVDIYAMTGTPVASAMRGLVVRVAYDPGGFGNYVVVKTVNAPDPADPSRPLTLYAGYAHLSETSVVEGSIVEKGQIVGRVGQTGFATTPHLHFQIDRDYQVNGQPGSHLSWPFTTKEATDVGLSFTEAVDSKVFQSRGLEQTISPVTYIQAHYAPLATAFANSVSSSSATVSLFQARRQERVQARLNRLADRERLIDSNAVLDARTTVAPLAAPTAASSPAPSPVSSTATSAPVALSVPVQPAATPFVGIRITSDSASIDRREWQTLVLRFVDEQGNVVANPLLRQDLVFRTGYGKADFRPATLSPLDIHDGYAKIQILAHSPTVVVQVQPGGYLSDPLKFELGK